MEATAADSGGGKSSSQGPPKSRQPGPQERSQPAQMDLDYSSSGSTTPEVQMSYPGGHTLTPQQLEKRQAEEKEFIRHHDSAEAHVWYLIDVNWLQAWKVFVTRGGQLPGPIDNSRLVDKQTGQAKSGLHSVEDYRGVNGEIWKFWLSRYGGGPTIKRKQLDLYSETSEDLVDQSGKDVPLPGAATAPPAVSPAARRPQPPQAPQAAAPQPASRRPNFFSIGSRGSSASASQRQQSQSQPQPQPQPQPQAAPSQPQERSCCDKCDGPHETDDCPHFKKSREKHADAWSSLGKAKKKGEKGAEEADGDGAPIIRNCKVVQQPADGSCLFHSMSYGLGREYSASSLRRDICDYIAKNPDMTIADTAIEDWIRYDSDHNETVGQYAQRMAGGTWGGGIEMAALTKMKNVNVHVYEKCSEGYMRISAFESPNARKTICVLYQGRMHYDAIVV